MSDEKFNHFKDLDMAFIPHPLTGDLSPLINYDAIKQSLKNILMSEKFSGIGSSFLFEPPDPITVGAMRKYIDFAIKKYEKRVKVTNIHIEVDDLSNYEVTVEYKIKASGYEDSLDYFFRRVR